jgi:hypothetical protein
VYRGRADLVQALRNLDVILSDRME